MKYEAPSKKETKRRTVTKDCSSCKGIGFFMSGTYEECCKRCGGTGVVVRKAKK